MSYENWIEDANKAFEAIGEDVKVSDSGRVTLKAFYEYKGGTQKFPIHYDGQIVKVLVCGVELSEDQYDVYYMGVEILDLLEITDVVTIYYESSTHNDQVYGVRIDQSKAAPEVERIGNMSLHASLPIQSKMRRAVILDDGTVNYYLHASDSSKKEDGTTANLNGSDGQVMTEIPIHWRRFDPISDDVTEALFSLYPFPGAHEVKSMRSGRHPMWIGSFKAALDRINNKLSSVVNLDPQFRGGNNQSAGDGGNEYESQLGKPVTVKNRVKFQAAAKNRGDIWYCYDYEVRKAMNWLLLLEYANRNSQAPFDATLTPEGFQKGGLGNGVVGINNTDWLTFNGRYPLFRCGKTLSLGNKTGEIPITLTDFPTTGLTANTQCFSYRGVENIFGDIWEWLDGINVEVAPGVTSVLPQYRVGQKIQNNGSVGYREGSEMPKSNGYIKKMYIGKYGDLTPVSNSGASSTTYWCDYFWRSTSEGLRGLLVSARAYYGASAGAFCSHSGIAPSASGASAGSRLCIP